MKLYDVATKKTKTIFNPWQESFTVAWSPDSTMIAALTRRLTRHPHALVIDVVTGKLTKVATGYFNGVSFSPESTELVYGLSQAAVLPAEDRHLPLPARWHRRSVALTHDHISASPLWGPTGQIVFVSSSAPSSASTGRRTTST